MKNTKRCPKCGGSDILVLPGHIGKNAFTKSYVNYIPVGGTLFSSAPVDRYICRFCGFTEEWINTNDIPAVEQFYSNKH